MTRITPWLLAAALAAAGTSAIAQSSVRRDAVNKGAVSRGEMPPGQSDKGVDAPAPSGSSVSGGVPGRTGEETHKGKLSRGERNVPAAKSESGASAPR
jgi:hypothetical protein